MAKEKRTTNEVVGETLLDLGKLIFGGVILAGIFDSGVDKVVLLFVGLAFFFTIMVVGIYLTTKK